MSCGCTACQETLTLDPWKRVHYAQGLVLGVDEFLQDELRFLEGERRGNRALHGYGTVCGLEVRVRDTGSGPEIFVTPGLAIDPKGRWIYVPEARCALLNEWLRRNPEAVGSPPTGSPPGTLTLVLRLCYRECPTDLVPIPGGPCRTADESMSPSRIAESFALDLTAEAPDQAELEAVRAFARLLGRLRVVPEGAAALNLDEFLAMVRAIAPVASPPGSPTGSPTGSPPVSSPASPSSPPGSPDSQFDIPEAEIDDYLHAAFRIWVTEVRPALLPPGQGCAAGIPEEGCILLAWLSFPTVLGGTGSVVDGDATAVSLDETDRPYLIHTQLLQELWLNGAATGAGSGAEIHADLLGLDQDDHLQYLAVADRRGGGAEDLLLRNLSGGGAARITGLPEAAASGEAMPFGQTADGDLSGSYPDPTVIGLQGLPVPLPAVADTGLFLRVAGSDAASLRWELAAPPGGGGGGDTEEGLVRIFALSWRHNEANDFRFDLDGNIVFGIAFAFGRDAAGDAAVRLGIGRDANGNVLLDLGSLDASSVRLFVELPDDVFPGFRRIRLQPNAIIGIRPDVGPGATIFSAGSSLGDAREAPGALLVFERGVLADLPQNRFEVELLGDHVIAADDGRAIDAEFLRSELPSGDRPGRVPRGIQGGPFVSWFTSGRRTDPDRPFNINLANVDDLIARANVPERVAMNIVNARNARAEGFASLDELRAVPNVGPAILRRIVAGGRFTAGSPG